MKPIVKVSVAIVLCSTLVFTATGCNQGDSTGSEEQSVISTVERGDLALDVSAVGNLVLSETDVLSFDLAGTVDEVNVEAGDYVSEGQVLVSLDTSDRDDYLKKLSKEIALKDQALLQAEIDYQDALDALEVIKSDVYVEQKTTQAELNVINAEIALATAQEQYDEAKEQYYQNWTVPERIRTYEQKTKQLEIAELNLIDARNKLDEVMSEIEIARVQKEKALVIVQSQLDDAQSDYDDAVAARDEAQIQTWEITAPYEGYITKVNATEGTDIQKGAAAVTIADPNQFEADVLVSEVDISNIYVGSIATVQVDASPTTILTARVNRISPTATISSGVVNYTVNIQIQAADAVTFNTAPDIANGTDMGNIFQDATDAIESGELPAGMQGMVDQGLMTEEEAFDLLEKMQSGEFSSGFYGEGSEGITIPEGGRGAFPGMSDNSSVSIFPGGGGFNFNTGVQPISSDGTFKLREGLTVTVSIITDTRTNVLLVPSGAVSTVNGQSVVTVIKENNVEEERVVETGLSDWQNTEILDGLEEGEQVLVHLSSTTTTDSFTIMPGGGVVFREVGGGR